MTAQGGFHIPLKAEEEMLRSVAVLAFAGAAAAFSPMMSMETGRRQVVQAGAAAAVAAPLLRASPASAGMDKSGRAPVITIMDHRGCNAHDNKEYKGTKSNDQDDEMCVKVQSVRIKADATKFVSSKLVSTQHASHGPSSRCDVESKHESLSPFVAPCIPP